MSGDDRTPDKTIGQIKYADDKTPMAEQEKTGLKGGDSARATYRMRPVTDMCPKASRGSAKAPSIRTSAAGTRPRGSPDAEHPESQRQEKQWPSRRPRPERYRAEGGEQTQG
jgi:hypothetical protein